jgi:hypothetical protein
VTCALHLTQVEIYRFYDNSSLYTKLSRDAKYKSHLDLQLLWESAFDKAMFYEVRRRKISDCMRAQISVILHYGNITKLQAHYSRS